jgi:hypothetical protein
MQATRPYEDFALVQVAKVSDFAGHGPFMTTHDHRKMVSVGGAALSGGHQHTGTEIQVAVWRTPPTLGQQFLATTTMNQAGSRLSSPTLRKGSGL